jgi:hypothetical protein
VTRFPLTLMALRPVGAALAGRSQTKRTYISGPRYVLSPTLKNAK